jgi:hypothetical protein
MSSPLPEFQNVLSVASKIARAFDVLPVDVNSILGVMAEIRQCVRGFMDGP